MELVWDVRPGFQLFGATVRYYSLIYSLTLVAGWWMILKQVERGGGEERDGNWLVAVVILATFLGGRLGHLIFYEWERLTADPTILWQFREGGIASHGGALAILVGTWAFAKFKRIPWLEVTDRTALAVALGTATIRIGNLFNSEVVGRLTDQTWGVRFPYYDVALDPAPLRHPSQLYEFALGMAILGLLYVVDRRFGEGRPRGLLTALYFALYFLGRFVIEFVKEYQALPTDAPLTMGQLLSVPLSVAGFVTVAIVWRRNAPAGWTEEARAAQR